MQVRSVVGVAALTISEPDAHTVNREHVASEEALQALVMKDVTSHTEQAEMTSVSF